MRIRLLAAGLPREGESQEDRARRVWTESQLLRDYRQAASEGRGASVTNFRAALAGLNARAARVSSDEEESYWHAVARHAGRVEREARKHIAAARAQELVPRLLEAGLAERIPVEGFR